MKTTAAQSRTASKISQTQEMKILRKIVEVGNADFELDFVLKEIVGIVTEYTKADSVFIYLLDEEKKSLILLASKTPHKKVLGKINLKMGEGLTGWVAREEKPVVIKENAFKDPRFKTFEALPEDKYEAFLGVPIVFKNRTIGVINVQHRSPHSYSSSMVNLIATIAQLVGGVVEHARLYEDTRLKALQFDSIMKVSQSITSEKYLDEILHSIVKISAEMLSSKICSIMLLSEKGDMLTMKATQSLSEAYRAKPNIPVNSSLSGEVLLSKKPRAVFDVTKEQKYVYRDLAIKEGLSSLLLVPMVVKEKAVGIVNVYTKAPHHFSEEEIRSIQIISNQAAVTVENYRLTAEGEEAKEALETRKLVDRAKGILMSSQRLTEDAAYKLIRKKSMDSCRSMKEIAEAIILTADL